MSTCLIQEIFGLMKPEGYAARLEGNLLEAVESFQIFLKRSKSHDLRNWVSMQWVIGGDRGGWGANMSTCLRKRKAWNRAS